VFTHGCRITRRPLASASACSHWVSRLLGLVYCRRLVSGRTVAYNVSTRHRQLCSSITCRYTRLRGMLIETSTPEQNCSSNCHLHQSEDGVWSYSRHLRQDAVVKNVPRCQSWMNGTHCLNQLFLLVPWIRSRSASTCSWDADDMSIRSESLPTAHQLWPDLIILHRHCGLPKTAAEPR